MISKKSTIFFSVLICIAGSLLFYLKYSVMDMEDRIKTIKKELVEEKKNQHILRAEWKALTTPERIQRLAVKHLHMQQIEPKQLSEYDPSIFHNDTKKHKKSAKRLTQLISEMMTDGDEQ